MRTVSLFREQLIPAWAGKTGSITSNASDPKAHPRMGGENGGCTRAGVTTSGSSPRGRGKRSRRIHLGRQRRLIPAWAGKTESAAAGSPCWAAHPRVGGENAHGLGGTEYPEGSSPRGRGKRERSRRGGAGWRLIPARAGKTITRTSSRSRRRAHPRAGGENGTLAVQDLSATGSSPRGRGKLHHAEAPIQQIRLIPARAGKTDFRRLR